MATANESSNAFGEIVPQSVSASSSIPTKEVRYDVFINHRGSDTKHTLATSIYNTLKPMGLQVFLDKPELEFGDSIPSEIEKAMTTSFLHIAILSPRYAESVWCLAELSFMLKTGNRIIPVFYNVDYRDIRWGKGIYADAFSKYEAGGRYTPEKLKDWRTALQKVTYLQGYTIDKENDDEGKLLKAIEDYIKEHSQKIPLVVAMHRVGLDEIIQDFERSVFNSVEDVKIVGIIGMGGCGKTTLAKEYYNKTRFSIYKCSFIHNVRDVPKKDLHNKQKKMLQDLGFNDAQNFDDIESGKAILAKHLRSIQVFIILDDVDHQDQLEALLPEKGILEQGSVIVVTSKESDVLTSWGISTNSIYKMKKLHSEHTIELFCWHAFQQPSPEDGFKSLVQDFLEVCQGLPLSLKILGGLVRGKRQDYWVAQLHKFSRVLHKDIKETLKVSFDALDKEEQEIFLDISYFLLGEQKHLVISVCDGYGWSGLHSLETLENKCLVEFDEENRITMHDHLRDLGKEIANTRSPYRLWLPQQITHIEKQGQVSLISCFICYPLFQESVAIRAIHVETEEFFEKCMQLVRGSGRRFEQRLEMLVVNGNYFTEELATLSEGLVWLRWDWFPHRSLPSWLSLKKLRVLELHGAYKLEELWSETADPPVELTELIISYANSFLRFPSSIGCLQHLKKISLWAEYGASFEDLPEEFCRLQSLEHLKLIGCRKLKSLPSKFGDLTNLRHLDLSECPQLMTLPASFKQLIHLQYISLAWCEEFTFPPDILENMTKLETLDVARCEKLQELPPEITNLVSLKKLDMAHTSIKELPNNIGLLSKLEQLRIFQSSLNTLPASIVNLSSLTSLDIDGCPIRELAILPGRFSSSLCNLKSIKISSTLVPRISISSQCCPSLETLDVSYNEELVEIHSLPISAKDITLMHCGKLKSIRGVCGLENLEKLFISDCGELHELPNFKELVSLKEFVIMGPAEHLKKIEGLEYCIKLEKLSIFDCEELHELPDFSKLVSLKEFVIREAAEHLKKIEGLEYCIKLEKLSIFDCEELHELPNFSKLVSLKEFILRTAEHLKKIEGLEYCRSLEKLIARTLWKVPVIQSLENMESLRTLHLSAHCNISELEPCLQTIKKEKWPSECIICARTAPGVEGVLKSLTFPALTLVHSCERKTALVGFSSNPQRADCLTIKCGQRRSSNAAAMFCFVINAVSSGISLQMYIESHFGATLKEGKWVCIGVLTQRSLYKELGIYTAPLASYEDVGISPGDEDVGISAADISPDDEDVGISPDDEDVGISAADKEKDMGMLVMGEEKSVVEAFYEVLQHLGKVV